MTDEFTRHRRTKVFKRLGKSLSEAAAGGYEPAQRIIDNMQAMQEAVEDTKASLRAFVNDLRDPQVLGKL